MPRERKSDLQFKWYENLADRIRIARDNVYTEYLAYGAALGVEFYAWSRFTETAINSVLNNHHEISNIGIAALTLATGHLTQWIRRESSQNIEDLGEVRPETYAKKLRSFFTRI